MLKKMYPHAKNKCINNPRDKEEITMKSRKYFEIRKKLKYIKIFEMLLIQYS